nr:hypothetical protein CFP56_38952 [Quercus suber]
MTLVRHHFVHSLDLASPFFLLLSPGVALPSRISAVVLDGKHALSILRPSGRTTRAKLPLSLAPRYSRVLCGHHWLIHRTSVRQLAG